MTSISKLSSSSVTPHRCRWIPSCFDIVDRASDHAFPSGVSFEESLECAPGLRVMKASSVTGAMVSVERNAWQEMEGEVA